MAGPTADLDGGRARSAGYHGERRASALGLVGDPRAVLADGTWLGNVVFFRFRERFQHLAVVDAAGLDHGVYLARVSDVVQGVGCQNEKVGCLASFYRALHVGDAERFGRVPRGREQGLVRGESALDEQFQLAMQAEPHGHAKRAVGPGVHSASSRVKLSYELFLRFEPKLGAPSAWLGVWRLIGDLKRVFVYQLHVGEQTGIPVTSLASAASEGGTKGDVVLDHLIEDAVGGCEGVFQSVDSGRDARFERPVTVPVTAVFVTYAFRAIPGVDEVHAAEVTGYPRAEPVSFVDSRGDDVGRRRLVELDSVGAAVEEHPNRDPGVVGSLYPEKPAPARNTSLDDLADGVDSRPRQLSAPNLLAQAEYPFRIVADIADGRDAGRHA